jgi:hypothetical protein
MRKICFLAKDMHFRGTIRRKRTCQFCGYPLQVSRASRNICEETFLSIVSVDRWKVGRVMRIRRVSRCAFPKKCSSEISSMLFKKHECCANGQRSPTPIYIYIHTHKHNSNLFSFKHLFLVFLSKSISSSNLISTTTLFFVFYISYNQIITTGLFCEFILRFFLYIIFS